MSMHSEVMAIVEHELLGFEPACRIEKLVDVLTNWGEKQYMAGGEMQKKLLRIKLGLGTEQDR